MTGLVGAVFGTVVLAAWTVVALRRAVVSAAHGAEWLDAAQWLSLLAGFGVVLVGLNVEAL